MTVAYAGIGTGVVLLAGLGAWTLMARRSAAGAAAAPAGPGPAGGPGGRPGPLPGQSPRTDPNRLSRNGQFEPPQGW